MSPKTSQSSAFNPDTFNEYADFYDGTLAWPYRQELEIPTIKKLLGNITGLNIMDFGCGPGVITRWLHAQGAEHITGYDISEGMLSYARQQEAIKPLGIEYISEIENQYNNHFDIILAIYVMPYATNLQELQTMSEHIFKMLKPGGKFITLPVHPDFNPHSGYYSPFGFQLVEIQPRKDASKLQLELRIPPHNIDIEAHYWSKSTLEHTLYQAGFGQITWESLQIPDNLSPHLQAYAECPHAAIIQAIKN